MTKHSDAIDRICRDLQLPPGDAFTQDWAYEIPNQFRTPAHFSRYLRAYSTPGYGEPEKLQLMELMLDVANDFHGAEGQAAWKSLEALIRLQPALHRDQVAYWSVFDTELEDAFRITSLVRELWADLYGAFPEE
jgi:hypothetical protein